MKITDKVLLPIHIDYLKHLYSRDKREIMDYIEKDKSFKLKRKKTKTKDESVPPAIQLN